ncbi:MULTISPECIES: hypothetical protein [unclassified Microbacterium]|uniref:hypothetical protein n=1 Tax=unclassified Microbacterium TaxID=2609290 RepID=UPI00366211D2
MHGRTRCSTASTRALIFGRPGAVSVARTLKRILLTILVVIEAARTLGLHVLSGFPAADARTADERA